MSVAFEELEGSPRIQLNEQGVIGLRSFRVAWDDWQTLARELVGTFRAIGLVTNFSNLWSIAWLTAWLFAFPVVLLITPLTRKAVQLLTTKN